MIERRIKELAVALEALSRIRDAELDNTAERIRYLLEAAVRQAETENRVKAGERTYKTDDVIPF